jgi:hypothetical protein
VIAPVLALGVLLVPVGAAWARGGDWEPVVLPPEIEAACGATTVHLTFPVNDEYQRNLPQPDGSVVQQVTGRLVARFTTDAGAVVTANISGPGKAVLYPDGDVETVSTGRYGYTLTPVQAAELGTPQIFTSSGPIDFVQHPDGSITPISLPHHVTDVCAELGAG